MSVLGRKDKQHRRGFIFKQQQFDSKKLKISNIFSNLYNLNQKKGDIIDALILSTHILQNNLNIGIKN